MSSADPQPAQPSSSKTPSPRPSRNPTRKLNPAVRRSSLLLAPTVAAPSAAAATIEHSYVFPSDNNANSNGISPGTSPLTTPSELPQLAPAEPTIYEAGNVASAAEMALRERKDSEASLKRASLFQTLSSNGMRRSRTMSIDSASDSGSESRVPALASLLETKQKDDASRTPTPPTATATAGATVSRAIPVRKLTKDKSDGYSSGVGSDSEGGSDSGLAPKKSAAAKRFGILRGAFGFGMKKRQASDASSTGVPELSVPAVAAPTEATPVPVAAEPIDIPRPAPIAVEAVPPVGDAGEVQLMSPVMEEFVPPPIPQALKPEENTVTLSPAHDALDLSSPPASPAVTMNTRSARPPVYTQPTSISIPPENEESTESAIVNDSEASVEEPTSAAKANMNGDHLEPLKDDDGASIISRMTPVSSNADLEHDHGNDPGYLTRKYASPPEGQTPRVREEDDGHHSEWEDEAIATSRLNNRASFITEEGTLASDEGSDVHQTRPNRAGLSFIAALAEKTKRQVLDEGQEEGDADSMQNHRGDEAEEDQRVPSTPFIMGFPTTTPAIMTTQGRNMTNEPIQELITPPITPESSKFPETAVPKVVEEHNEASPILPASTDAQPGSSSSPLTMATQYAVSVIFAFQLCSLIALVPCIDYLSAFPLLFSSPTHSPMATIFGRVAENPLAPMLCTTSLVVLPHMDAQIVLTVMWVLARHLRI
ncbi:hypothetical protein FRB97_009288 [Tulasnella sp. 331]|nr:hypothetical protein FRB97_009288 [Tulasnella sp. 331]